MKQFAFGLFVLFVLGSFSPKICIKIFYLLILERKGKGGGEREKKEREFCCSTYLCIHCLILVCALSRDQTHNPSILG